VAEARKEGLETEIITVDPRQIELLEINARFMSAEMYHRLVENIRYDGCLTSVPLCYRTPEGKLRCISGNHRTKAAIDAELAEISIQVITTPISNDEFIAKQLSHNAINGKDNEEILRMLWYEMQDPDMKEYSGLDKELIEKIELPQVMPVDVSLDYEQVTLLFLGTEKGYIRQVAEEIVAEQAEGQEVWLESRGAYDEVAAVIQTICERQKIQNYTTAFLRMAEYAKAYLDEQDAGEVTPVTRSTTS